MMNRRLLAFVLAVLLLAPAGARADTLTGRLLVTLEPQAPDRARASVLALAGARQAGPRVPEIDLLTVRPGAGRTLAETARSLRRRTAVASVQVERRAQLRLQPDDPALTAPETSAGTPPGVPVQWWAARTGLFAAWDVTRGAGATVAIIDTGLDAGHPDLAGKVAATSDQDGTSGNGPPTTDENGHGTHVASMACASGSNATGIVGAGLDCRLLVVKTDLSDSSVAASIVDAANRGANAINMSFGTDGTRPPAKAIADAIDFAVARNVVLVAAAADAPVEEQGDPANLLQPTGTGPDLGAGKGLSVTASNFAGERASFAGRGSQISLAAPGQFLDDAGPPGILGAFPGNPTELERGGSLLFPMPPCNCRTSFGGDSRYAYLQGTSMAAPMVAAVAALVRDLNPDLAAPEVIRLLKETASRPAGTGFDPEVGWGILDAGKALNAARTVDRRAPRVRQSGPRSRSVSGRRFTLRWRGSDQAPAGVARSGVASYDVLRSAGGGAYRRIARQRRSQLRARGVPGRAYRYKIVGTDRAGNRGAVESASVRTVRVRR